MNYMGIDHHMQYSHITLLDEKGEKLKSGRVANLRSELENFLSGIKEVKAVVEELYEKLPFARLIHTVPVPDVERESSVYSI